MIGLAAGIFVAVIEIAVIPEKRDEFIAESAKQAPVIRQYEGNLQFDVLVDPSRPDRVFYLERWVSEDANKKFFAWWMGNGMASAIKPFVSGPPKETTYTQVVD
ncbi:MAG TPA: putative quinol monooxygenase [Hyphomonadaceae bacterium]|jgi:quinol monooxygenase YgiN|nr:putative quinol monooxygenase [Hyphomonadaceae bacterium]